MKKYFFIALGTFILGFLISMLFNLPQKFFSDKKTTEVKKQCEYQKDSETFSKKFYFSKEEADALLGKKVQNLKCGKIKCPVRSNDCLNVEIGEIGKVTSIKPRQGFSDYTIIIEWNEPRNKKDTFAEQGLDGYVSYVGKDDSYKIDE